MGKTEKQPKLGETNWNDKKTNRKNAWCGKGGFEFDECFLEPKCDEALHRLKHNRNKYVKGFAREAFMTPNLFPERACERFSQRTSIFRTED